jgi:hypothetical protein
VFYVMTDMFASARQAYVLTRLATYPQYLKSSSTSNSTSRCHPVTVAALQHPFSSPLMIIMMETSIFHSKSLMLNFFCALRLRCTEPYMAVTLETPGTPADDILLMQSHILSSIFGCKAGSVALGPW